MGFAFDRVSLVHAFEIRRAKAPDSELVAALKPSYRLAGLNLTPRMRHHKIRYRFKSISPQRSLSTQRLYIIFFSAFSANSAVNTYVSFSIKLATPKARGALKPEH